MYSRALRNAFGTGRATIFNRIASLLSMSSEVLKASFPSPEAMSHTYTAILQKEGDGYVSTCPEVGTTSQGATVEEAVANLKEATELYLEEFPHKDAPRPLLTTFEVGSDKT
jgi:predicted RNase H-like HicB family nuclease